MMDILEVAREFVPDGWEIIMSVSGGHVSIELFDPDDCSIEFCSEPFTAEEEFVKAINRARDGAGLLRIDRNGAPANDS